MSQNFAFLQPLAVKWLLKILFECCGFSGTWATFKPNLKKKKKKKNEKISYILENRTFYSKIKKSHIFQQTELSSPIFFVYFRKELSKLEKPALKKFLMFREMELSSSKINNLLLYPLLFSYSLSAIGLLIRHPIVDIWQNFECFTS